MAKRDYYDVLGVNKGATADQIKSIFAGAEKAAVDSGSNQTMLGKAGSGVAAVAKLPVKLAKAAPITAD